MTYKEEEEEEEELHALTSALYPNE